MTFRSFTYYSNHHFLISLVGLIELIGLFLMFVSCNKTPEYIISNNDFDSLQLAPFVEPNFPFISTSLDLRDMAPGLPADNLVSRGIVMMLGDSTYACFDTDLLRWSVGWTGDFISLTGMAQISYDDFFNKKNKFPKVLGSPKLATGIYLGWELGESTWQDPREKDPPDRHYAWGPISEELGRYDGLYLQNDGVVLKYSVDEVGILEKPGSQNFEGGTVFVRNLRIEPHTENLILHLAEVANGVETISETGFAYVYHDGRDTVTAIGLMGSIEEVGLEISDDQYLSAVFSGTGNAIDAGLVIWKGRADEIDAFKTILQHLTVKSISSEPLVGSTRWSDKVYTREMRSPDTSAFVVDQLMLPLPNPWNRNVRIMDVAFFEDGTAMVVSFAGDVWSVEGIGTEYMTWSRFASGLNEPMSIEILRDTVYVYDRLGITRFYDRNNDGEADYYENFSNVMPQSIDTREWPSDMVVDPQGGLYVSKGGALFTNQGIGPPTTKGFRMGSRLDGSIVWISPDGRKSKRIATGFRGPYLGINPVTGMLTASDQQGNFVPSTPVYNVQVGDYFGVPSTAHGADTADITPPLLWIPHHVDPSGLGQVWVMSDRMGPLNDQLIHISFSRPGLFKVLVDSSGQPWQGGVSFIKGHYPTPVSKGAVSPTDGFPYFAGFNLFGSPSTGISSLIRLRYTGKPDPQPVSFQAGRQGLVLEFGEELDSDYSEKIAHYRVKRYNYRRTQEYGSGHYRLDGSPGEGQLPVLSAYLSSNKKRLFLSIPNMTPVDQMEISYDLRTATGDTINDQFWFTVHHTEPLDFNKLGLDQVDESSLVMEKSIVSADHGGDSEISLTRGETIFNKMACAGCHSPGTRTEGMYGPPFHDLYGSMQEFEDGNSRRVDEAYLRESIYEPNKQVVKGYSPEMPAFLGILNDAEMESIILYIKSLSNQEKI